VSGSIPVKNVRKKKRRPRFIVDGSGRRRRRRRDIAQLVRTYVRNGQKHGRRESKITRDGETLFFLKQMYLSANNDNAKA
jgi:hypothetical protein